MITKSDYEKIANFIAANKPEYNPENKESRKYRFNLSLWQRKVEFIDICFLATQENYNSKLFLTSCNYSK